MSVKLSGAAFLAAFASLPTDLFLFWSSHLFKGIIQVGSSEEFSLKFRKSRPTQIFNTLLHFLHKKYHFVLQWIILWNSAIEKQSKKRKICRAATPQQSLSVPGTSTRRRVGRPLRNSKLPSAGTSYSQVRLRSRQHLLVQ